MMIPSIGRMVHYRLSTSDANEINRRRTTGQSIGERSGYEGGWPQGAQAHIGNPVHAGDIFPAMIVRLWDQPEHPVTATTLVQLQVFLDGNDTYWATSVSQLQPELGDQWPCWFEPPRVLQPVLEKAVSADNAAGRGESAANSMVGEKNSVHHTAMGDTLRDTRLYNDGFVMGYLSGRRGDPEPQCMDTEDRRARLGLEGAQGELPV